MTTDADKTVTDLKDQIVLLSKRAVRAEKMAELNDAQKSYAKRLSDDGLATFLAKSDVERADEVKKQIVYTSPVNGEVFYSFDDQRHVTLAKRADESDKTATEQRAIAKRGEYIAKARETMSAYPGTEDVHIAAYAAIDTISDETLRKSVHEMIAAGQAAIQKRMGHSGITPIEKNANGAGTKIEKAESDLRTKVEAYQKAQNLPSYEVAFAKGAVSDSAVRAAYDALMEARAGF